MHKTATGRWQPDPPKRPEPDPVMAPACYPVFLLHLYTHAELADGCPFCYPPPLPSELAPWGMLAVLDLDG